jgi:hypothetical protein
MEYLLGVSYKIRLHLCNLLSGWQETKCSTLGSARRDCDGSISYAKRETTPKLRKLLSG